MQILLPIWLKCLQCLNRIYLSNTDWKNCSYRISMWIMLEGLKRTWVSQDPRYGEILIRIGKWQPSPISLPGKSHEQRSLMDYNPWGCKELAQLSDWACMQGRNELWMSWRFKIDPFQLFNDWKWFRPLEWRKVFSHPKGWMFPCWTLR